MKLTLLAMALISTNTISTEINVDLNNLSNKSTLGDQTLSVESIFYGYEIESNSKYRFVDLVDLNGIDWAFWYDKNKSISQDNTTYISQVNTFGQYTYKNQAAVHGNEYFWLGNNSRAFANQSNHAISASKGAGFSFTVTPNKIGKFKVDLYTHNWLSSSNFTVCLKNNCETIKNDISFAVTSTKNTVNFITSNLTDVLTITYTATPRQWDWSQKSGYHSLEAINLSEVK